MAQKPENVFRNSVHRYKSKRVHQEKTNNAFRGGIPDDYYEGNGSPGILWVEYKYATKIPRELLLTAKNSKPNLSDLQAKWLDRAYRNGKQVAVIVGSPRGGVILTDNRWLHPITSDEFESMLMSRQEIMKWIEEQVLKNGSQSRPNRRATKLEEDYPQPQSSFKDAMSGLGDFGYEMQNRE